MRVEVRRPGTQFSGITGLGLGEVLAPLHVRLVENLGCMVLNLAGTTLLLSLVAVAAEGAGSPAARGVQPSEAAKWFPARMAQARWQEDGAEVKTALACVREALSLRDEAYLRESSRHLALLLKRGCVEAKDAAAVLEDTSECMPNTDAIADLEEEVAIAAWGRQELESRLERLLRAGEPYGEPTRVGRSMLRVGWFWAAERILVNPRLGDVSWIGEMIPLVLRRDLSPTMIRRIREIVETDLTVARARKQAFAEVLGQLEACIDSPDGHRNWRLAEGLIEILRAVSGGGSTADRVALRTWVTRLQANGRLEPDAGVPKDVAIGLIGLVRSGDDARFGEQYWRLWFRWTPAEIDERIRANLESASKW